MDIQPLRQAGLQGRDTRVNSPGQGALDINAARDNDGYAPGMATMKDAAADMARAVFGGISDAAKSLTALSVFKTEPLMNAGTAGWKASLMGAGGTNCFIKVPAQGGDSLLVIPLQNHYGGSYGSPVVVDSEKGLTALANMKPFCSSQALRVAQSPDGKVTFMTACSSPLVKSYDEHFKPLPDIDLSSLNSDFGRVLDFTCGSSANYAYVISPAGDKKYVLSLQPGTNSLLWANECGDVRVGGLYEAPDGSLCMACDDRYGKNAKHFLQVYSKEGKDRGSMEFPGEVKDMAFLANGAYVVNNGHKGVRAVDVSRLKPGQYATLWVIPGKDYVNFLPTADGKSLIALDRMEGFCRCHKLAKIDAKTGAVEWEKTFLKENIIDCRLIGDDLHVLTASQDRTMVNMKKMDLNGAAIWGDSVRAGEIDEYDEGMSSCITAGGNFVFGGRQDGCLYFLHPTRPGETDASLRQNLGNLEEKMETIRNDAVQEAASDVPAGAEFEENDQAIIIDGVKMEKKKP